MPFFKMCVECGCQFEPTGQRSNRQLICSAECKQVRSYRSHERYRKRDRDLINARNRERWARLRPKRIVNCVVCGSEFAPKTVKVVACSQSCEVIRINALKRARRAKIRQENGWIFGKHRKGRPRKPRICTACGSVFFNGPGCHHKCCSLECAEIRKTAHIIKMQQAAKPRFCSNCGKSFVPRNPKGAQRCCSYECGKARQREGALKVFRGYMALQLILKGSPNVDVR